MIDSGWLGWGSWRCYDYICISFIISHCGFFISPVIWNGSLIRDNIYIIVSHLKYFKYFLHSFLKLKVRVQMKGIEKKKI